MDVLSPKERLLRSLKGEAVDRAPVICPGGMMNSAIVDVMKNHGNVLPDGHRDSKIMADLALDVQADTGFENVGIPFCMTVEAEALGSDIDFGTLKCEPKIAKEIFPSVKDVIYKADDALVNSPRAGTVFQAIYNAAGHSPDIPVIGSITGPLSTAASVVDPMNFLKELRKVKDESHRFVDYVTNQLIGYARYMVDNGASVISIADPTATGEILGPKMFGNYAVVYINKLVDAIHEMGVPVIVHICGRMQAVTHHIANLHADAISVDALVSLKKLKEAYPQLTTMGNLSTFLLEFGEEPNIQRGTEQLIQDEINILAPACGLSTSTPLSNIRTFTGAAKAV